MTEQVAAEVPAQASQQVEVEAFYLPKPMKFFFRTKEVINELGEKTKVKRPTVDLAVPVPTLDGLIKLLNEGDATKIAGLLSVLEGVIYTEAKAQVDDDESITQEKLDLSKLTLDYILSLPPTQRSSTAPSEEQWKLFEADYPTVMAAVQPDKTAQQIALARDIFIKKINPAKEKPDLIRALKNYLALWFTNTQQQEELSTVFEYLNNRADNLMAAPPKVLDLSAI